MNKILKEKIKLAKLYDTDESKIVWVGSNLYMIVLRNGTEIKRRF